MIEPGEVNGVRFFQGIINAKAEDAEKLISSGKAIFIDDEGNPVESKADDSEGSEDITNPEADTTDNGTPTDDKNADDPFGDAGGKWITVMTVILLTQRLAPLMRLQS